MGNETGTMACTQNTWQHNGVDDLHNGHWILNIGLPSGRPKKSCPFCLARGLNRGTKGHMRTIMYMQWAYVQAERKLCHSPNPWTIPQKPYTFPWKRFVTLLHTPRPTWKIPIKFHLLYFERKLRCLRFQSLPGLCKIHTQIYMTCQIL